MNKLNSDVLLNISKSQKVLALSSNNDKQSTFCNTLSNFYKPRTSVLHSIVGSLPGYSSLNSTDNGSVEEPAIRTPCESAPRLEDHQKPLDEDQILQLPSGTEMKLQRLNR